MTVVRKAPAPKTAALAAYVMLLASEKGPENLSAAERGELLELSRKWAEKEPENSFWRQYAAVLEFADGNFAHARRDWVRASKSLQWNDYQSARLDEIHQGMVKEWRHEFAWLDASTSVERSIFNAQLIATLSRELLTTVPPEEDLEFRVASVSNGLLIRENSKSLASAAFGRQIIENSYKKNPGTDTSIHRLITARYEFIAELRKVGLVKEATEVEKTFSSNDTWLGITEPDQAEEIWRMNSGAAILSANISSGIFLSGICGIALFWGNRFLSKVAPFKFITEPWHIVSAAAIAGSLAYAYSRLIEVALFTSSVIAIQAFRVERTRKVEPEEIGLLFPFIASVIGLGVTATTVMAWLQASQAFRYLGPVTFEPNSVINVTDWGLISFVALLLPLLFARIWHWVLRVPAELLAARFVARTALTLAWTGFVGAAISTPICAVIDHHYQADILKMRQNEPKVYWDATGH
ncbi:MAG: hypothetical protein K8R88_11905 [Armatimonadetes bacterium]|nr:hypothetical protein [Armatimonadota bacterium]